jgi:hypothetical protein
MKNKVTRFNELTPITVIKNGLKMPTATTMLSLFCLNQPSIGTLTNKLLSQIVSDIAYNLTNFGYSNLYIGDDTMVISLYQTEE